MFDRITQEIRPIFLQAVALFVVVRALRSSIREHMEAPTETPYKAKNDLVIKGDKDNEDLHY